MSRSVVIIASSNALLEDFHKVLFENGYNSLLNQSLVIKSNWAGFETRIYIDKFKDFEFEREFEPFDLDGYSKMLNSEYLTGYNLSFGDLTFFINVIKLLASRDDILVIDNCLLGEGNSTLYGTRFVEKLLESKFDKWGNIISDL